MLYSKRLILSFKPFNNNSSKVLKFLQNELKNGNE
jgi:hypothetical protein